MNIQHRRSPLDEPLLLKRAKDASATPSESSTIETRSLTLWPRVPEASHGNYYVLFGRRLVIGPNWWALLSTVILVAVSSWFLLFRIIPEHATLSSMQTAGEVGVGSSPFTRDIHKVLAWSLTVSLSVLVVCTGTMNPGIIQRGSKDEISAFKQDIRPLSLTGSASPCSINETTGIPYPRYLTIAHQVTVRQKWCSTCYIYRPLRSNHCKHCDCCVARMDHHCSFLGGCVGMANYRWFFSLIWVVTLFSIFSAKMCWELLRMRWHEAATTGSSWLSRSVSGQQSRGTLHPKLLPFMFANVDELTFLALSTVSAVAFGVLSIYHFLIAGKNLTTNEHVKRYYRVNPFDSGITRNFLHLFCRPGKMFYNETPEVTFSYRAPVGALEGDCVSDLFDS